MPTLLTLHSDHQKMIDQADEINSKVQIATFIFILTLAAAGIAALALSKITDETNMNAAYTGIGLIGFGLLLAFAAKAYKAYCQSRIPDKTALAQHRSERDTCPPTPNFCPLS